MATAADFMNPRLVYVRDGDRLEIALGPMMELRLSAVPVLDDDHKPVGLITLRELADRSGPVHMSSILQTVSASASLEEAAQLLVAGDLHHLVVVDAHGVALGMLSTLDVLRGLTGGVPEHPARIESYAVQAGAPARP